MYLQASQRGNRVSGLITLKLVLILACQLCAFTISAAQQDDVVDETDLAAMPSLPTGVRLLRNVAYGKHEKQAMDVYLPQ